MDFDAKKMELQRAIQAGTLAVECLQSVRTELHLAEKVWPSDEPGGAFQTTREQTSRIATASRYACAAEQFLVTFQEKLTDPSLRIHVAVHANEFSSFSKTFLDGILADRVVRSRIQAAASACGMMLAAVSATIAECQRQLSELVHSQGS